MANAEIVAIGSELLLGQIVDTNSAWMAQRLTALGVNLYFKSVVGDNPGRMKEVIARALERAENTTKFDEIPVQAIHLMTRLRKYLDAELKLQQ